MPKKRKSKKSNPKNLFSDYQGRGSEGLVATFNTARNKEGTTNSGASQKKKNKYLHRIFNVQLINSSRRIRKLKRDCTCR